MLTVGYWFEFYSKGGGGGGLDRKEQEHHFPSTLETAYSPTIYENPSMEYLIAQNNTLMRQDIITPDQLTHGLRTRVFIWRPKIGFSHLLDDGKTKKETKGQIAHPLLKTIAQRLCYLTDIISRTFNADAGNGRTWVGNPAHYLIAEALGLHLWFPKTS